MPFLRLTRDRRGFENTFLLHADQPGERPRMLYWYRTAPGIVLGRAPLDEDAIRTIEDQHPDIDFDWPAILALSEVMTHEDEAPPPPRERRGKAPRTRDRQPQAPQRVESDPVPAPVPGPDFEAAPEPMAADDSASRRAGTLVPADQPPAHVFPDDGEPDAPAHAVPHHTTYGMLEELVGREIATRLRARHSEIGARIHEQYADALLRDAWLKRAEPLNPELWLTAQAVLDGVRRGDALFEQLRAELLAHSSRA